MIAPSRWCRLPPRGASRPRPAAHPHDPGQAYARVLRAPDTAGAVSHVERYHAKTREVFDAVGLFVAPSRFLAREFERYGLERERILYSDNGIDTTSFADCPYKQSGSIVRFGFLGSWMPSKGVHVLRDAFRGLTENARLSVFGGPPPGDPGEYARDILAAGADRRITFPGRIDPADVASVFRAIHVLGVPSPWYENAPLTIREAFAAHTPVVASRCGGMAESVRDGIDGLLFAPGDVAELTATLRRLIRDPELIPALSRQTPAIKTVAAHAAELETAFLHLMNQGQAA